LLRHTNIEELSAYLAMNLGYIKLEPQQA
jgi:hypothetical protein